MIDWSALVPNVMLCYRLFERHVSAFCLHYIVVYIIPHDHFSDLFVSLLSSRDSIYTGYALFVYCNGNSAWIERVPLPVNKEITTTWSPNPGRVVINYTPVIPTTNKSIQVNTNHEFSMHIICIIVFTVCAVGSVW